MKHYFRDSVVSASCILFLMSCATTPVESRNPASTSIAPFNWSTIQDTFQGSAWELISPSEASKYTDIYFVSDVHGRLVAFANLLYQAKIVDSKEVDANGAKGNWIGRNILLVLDGDYIDGGEDSAQALKWIETLHQQAGSKGSHVVIISGNHEGEFLADPSAKDIAKETLKSFASPSDIPAAVSFIKTFKIGAVIGSWFVAHSGYIVPDSGKLSDWLSSMSKAWESGQYTLMTDKDGKGVAGVLEKHDWWGPLHANEHQVLSSIGLNGFIGGHEPGLFGGDKEKILISNEGWAVKVDCGLKDEKSDSDSIGEILHCASKNIDGGNAGFKTLDQCDRLEADGSTKAIKN